MIGDLAENVSILAMLHEAGVQNTDFKNLLHSYRYGASRQSRRHFRLHVADSHRFLHRQEETHAIWPLNYGIDFYGDLLYTSELEVESHPERAVAMRRAVLRGWQYALDHPEEIIRLIQKRHHCDASRQLVQAQETRKMIRPEYVELGHATPAGFGALRTFLRARALSRPTCP